MGRKRRKLEEKDFTAGAIHGQSPHKGSTGDKTIDERVSQLVHDWRCGARSALIEEMIITALNVGHDDAGFGELKTINRSMKEMRKAMQAFAPYRNERKISVFGSARTKPGLPEYEAALLFAEQMRERGFMSITGAGDGIMGAAQKGSGRDMSFGLNISLPFEQGANETIEGDPKLVEFNYFFTRKLSFMKESHAAALFPGGFGTMDEGFELLTLMQTGKAAIIPVVMVDAPGGSYWKTWHQFLREHLLRQGLISDTDFHLFKVTDNVDIAVKEITNFYKNFHSYRFVGDKMVIRLNDALTEESIETLNKSFPDLVAEGSFKQRSPLEEEKNEKAIADLSRIVFVPHQRNFGRLRVLIDTINTLQIEPEKE